MTDMDGISSLREAIRTVPVPGAPLPLSRSNAAVGLVFLDTALRQHHVRRVTERIFLSEHLAAKCRTELDVSLNLLSTEQRAAGQLPIRAREQAPDGTVPVPPTTQTVWVPVARLPRKSVASVDVVDAAGVRLPRLTQYETSRFLAAGLYRLLRGILATDPRAREDSDVGQFLYKVHESRWLVEAALYSLLTERHRPTKALRHPGTPDTVGGHGRQYRDIALALFENHHQLLDTYFELLNVAVNDYLLVVGLDSTQDEHLLSYESPLYVQRPPIVRRFWIGARAAEGIYRASYHGLIPPTLRSYHLVAEAEQSITIDRMFLITDSERESVSELSHDLTILSDRIEAELGVPTGDRTRKVLELELQTALRRLGEVFRRRTWESDQAAADSPEDSMPAGRELMWASISGEATRNDEGQPRNSLLGHRSVNPGALRSAARELVSMEAGKDISRENDPASSRAHAYWRRSVGSPTGSAPITITCELALRDTTTTRPRSVMTYALAVSATAYLVGWILTGSFWLDPLSRRDVSLTNADAVVAVLLLVPGFLYTRLDLPPRHSIAGQLGRVPRLVAHLCVGAMVAVSACFAAGLNGQVLRIAVALGIVLPILAGGLLLRRSLQEDGNSERWLDLPAWAARKKRARSAPDVSFYSYGITS